MIKLAKYATNHGLQTPNEAFFRQNPKLLGLGRQFGVFLANLLAPIKGQLISKGLFGFVNSPKKRI